MNMTPATRRFVFWAPRVLTLLFAAFVSIFAMDVFDEHLGFWQTIGALLLHLIPVGLLLVLLAVAWRWEWLGGVLFVALGVLFNVFPPRPLPWSVHVVMSGPLFVIGGLFLLDWSARREIRT
jgi:hypothetical protein